MGVTKAQFSQISSEIFNGIGSADLLHGCYDHLQQQQAINHTTHLRLTTSHKSHLYETIYSRTYQVKNYLFSKVYKQGIQKETFASWYYIFC